MRRYLTDTLKHLPITSRYLAQSTGTLRLHFEPLSQGSHIGAQMISLEGFPLSIGVKIWQPWVSGSKCSLKVPVAYARYLPVTGDHLMVLLRYLRFLSKSAGTWQVPINTF